MAEFAVRHTQELFAPVAVRAASGASVSAIQAAPGASVLIRRTADAATADVYTDRTKGTAVSNPVPTGVPEGSIGLSIFGNLNVFLDPDDLYETMTTVGGTTTGPFPMASMPRDPAEPIGAGAVEEAMLAFGVATQAELDAGLAGREPTIPPGTYARSSASSDKETISRPFEFEEETTNARGPVIDINAAMHGADPLGVQTGTFIPALQSAVDQAIAQGGGVIRARGTYLTTSGASLAGKVPENIIFDFEQARIIGTGPSHFLTINDGRRIRIIGGEFENPDPGTARYAIKLNGCSDVAIEGVSHVNGGLLETALGVASPSARCQRVRVSDSQCDGGGVAANLLALNGDYFTVERVKAHGTTADIVKPGGEEARYVWIEQCDFSDAGDDLIDLFGGGHFMWIVRNHFHDTAKALNLKWDSAADTSVDRAWVVDNSFTDVDFAARLLNAPRVKYRGNDHLRCGGAAAVRVVYLEGSFQDCDVSDNDFTGSLTSPIAIRAVAGTSGGQLRSARPHLARLNDNRFTGTTGDDIVNNSTSRNRVVIRMRGNDHIGGSGRAFHNSVLVTSPCTILSDGDYVDLTQSKGWEGLSPAGPVHTWIMRNNVVERGVRLAVNATSGNFTVTVGADTTANQDAATTTAATLQTAIDGLASVGGAGHIIVGGGPASASDETAFVVMFVPTGKWGLGINKPTISATNVSLAGGTGLTTLVSSTVVFTPEATATVIQDGNTFNGLREGPTANRPATHRYPGQTYRDTTTGQMLTWNGSSWLRLTPELTAVKAADDAGRIATTLIADDTLVIPVEANKTYVVDFMLVFDGSTAGDARFDFTGPAGATGAFGVGRSGGTSTMVNSFVALAGVVSHGTTDGGTPWSSIGSGSLIVAGTAGNLTLRWGQGATDAVVATRLLKGSYIRLQATA